MSSAARQRAYRRREQRGELVVTVTVNADVVDLLVESRLLDARAACHSREQISDALAAFLVLARKA